MGIRVNKEGFVWKTLEFHEARALHAVDVKLFILDPNGRTFPIQHSGEISQEIINNDVVIAVGQLPPNINFKSE